MKKQIIVAFALFSLLSTAGAFQAVSAQVSGRVVVNVPFEFVAGDERLPAGRYTVSRVTRDSEKAILIRGLDGRARAAAVLTHSINTAAAPDVAKLAFTQYGDRYFLAEVWTPDGAGGRAVPRSKSEKAPRRGLRQNLETLQVIAQSLLKLAAGGHRFNPPDGKGAAGRQIHRGPETSAPAPPQKSR